MNKSDKIRALNPVDQPMVETDYHEWLGMYDTGNNIDNKKLYLQSAINFIIGEDTIDKDVIETLRYIESNYYRLKFVAEDQKLIQPYLDHLERDGPGVPIISRSHHTLKALYNIHGETRIERALSQHWRDCHE